MKGRYPSQQSLLSSASTLQHSQQQQQQSVDPFRRHLRGRLKPAICRLFKRVHEQSRLSYTIADDAQEYLENYAIEKLATLFEPQAPSDIYEAEEKLGQVFASCSLDQEQINELRDQAMRKKKKNSTLYDSVHKSVRCDEIVCLFIVLVTEFVLCEILRVSLTYMIKIKVNDIKKVDIRIVVDTFFSNQASAPAESTWPQDYMATFPTEYRRAINELIYFEETFAQQLQIIGQLFKQPLVDLCPSSPDVDTIFSALSAITECTNFLYVALDDSRNITEHPPIGHCFYELSEEGHFDSYAKYAQDVLSVKCRDRLFELLGNSLVKEKFETVGREIELQAAGHLSYYSLLSSCPAPVPPPAAGAASKKNSDADGSSAQNHLNFYSHHHHHQVSDSVSAASSTATLTSLSTATTCASSSASPAGLEQGEELRAVMLLACRYLLPKLLLVPVYHFLYYDRILERFEQLQEKNMWHCRNGSSTARSASSGGAELESADDADAASQQQPSLCGSPVTSGYNADRRRSSSSLPVEVCSDDRDTIVQTRSILVSTSHRVKRTLDEFERRPVPAATVSAASIPGVGSNGDDSVSLSVSPTGGSDIEESASVVAAAAASGAASRMSNQQQRSVLLNPLASRLFFHASMSAPDSMHTDRACSKKLAQLRSMTRSAPELDLAKPRCTIFYKEGTLYQMERAGRFQERRVYLFNNRLFVMKASKTLPLRSINEEYRLKRVVFLLQHRFVLVDHPKPVTKPAAAGGTEEEMYTFSIEYLPSPDTVEGGATVGTAPIKQRITFATKSLLDKEEWMLILIYLQSYHMFEEYLSLKGLTDTAEAIHFPQDHRGYEYWQPDSDQVIELEENSESSSSESHVIRRATLNKLIERMTHYSGNIDSRLMKVFLMTFRSFCTPLHLLTKLISRFNFPEYTYVDFQTDDSMMSVAQAQLRKREFEDKYCRKVRLRVLKVMTTWIENYFHDFGKCPELVNGLRDFLNGPSVDKLYDIKKFQVPNLLKQLDRRSRGEGRRELVQSIEDYPEVLWHTARDKREFNIMTLHPLELARQITLYMFSLYMRIEPWELVTGDWMKTKEKQLRAPNVHNLIRYTNRLTWWCCLNVLKTNHLEERRCVLLRIYEIMKYFRSLNNFLGLAALDSVFVNSSIQYIRLQHTWKLIKNGKDNKFLEQVQELVSNGNTMRQYDELLRTLDTACVPNLRYHLSLIFRLLEINRVKGDQQQQQQQLTTGRTTALTTAEADATVMIPFFCYRQVAERIDELLKAKDTRYQLREEPSIQEFVRDINPMRDLELEEVDDTNQNQRLLDNIFYRMSNELEPKDADEDSLKRSGARRFSSEALRSPTVNGGGSGGGVGGGGKSAKKSSAGGGGGARLTSAPFIQSSSRPTSPLRDAQQQPPTPHQIVHSGKSSAGGSSGLTSPNGPIAQSPIVEDLTRQDSADHSRSISDPVPAAVGAAVVSGGGSGSPAAAPAAGGGGVLASHSNSNSGSSQLPPLPPRQTAGLKSAAAAVKSAAVATATATAAAASTSTGAAPPLPPRARKSAPPPSLPPRTSLRSSSVSNPTQ
ncbi:hypothetical protein BOX15_Mlig000650g1 [Macrostomum lignano]|uniref:Ras-GEF domain-containing protein n=1 Tax=Macrostomum lignano TaxID=282301 RepID=A0A267DM29_9PLAT|nr:hypothetical protein BOX15_Mlig000650g1 [Macrostomum lignano]